MTTSAIIWCITIAVLLTAIILFSVRNQPKDNSIPAKVRDKHSSNEIAKLEQQRKIKLNEPLAERTRPKSFDEIIGQQEGLAAIEAALCGPNPQHIIVYGPPGIGKTAAARLALEKAKQSPGTPFRPDAKMVEVDGATSRFDERGIADPLLGSVHDPIYQGAGSYGQAGIPQPKPGAVSKAHGGVLFIDEIGELHPIQLNKLLKVLEDRKVMLESSYYQEENKSFPSHIHDIFQNGLPADFRLIAATTRAPEELPSALRSRCVEVHFHPLSINQIKEIAQNSAKRAGFSLSEESAALAAEYAANGREAVNMIQLAAGLAQQDKTTTIEKNHLEQVIRQGRYTPRIIWKMGETPKVGVAMGLGIKNDGEGMPLPLEALVLPGTGRCILGGIVEEEEIGSGGHKIRRRSMARNSAENVITVLKGKWGIDFEHLDVHLNFPGGVPVDGPSAGVTIATALFSALKNIPIDNEIALTGEISIRGFVLPVGGVPAKIEAAAAAGAKKVIIPKDNYEPYFNELANLEIIPVSTIDEVFNIILLNNKKKQVV